VYLVVGDARMAKSEWSCGYEIRVYRGERQTATGRGLVDDGKGTRMVAEDGGRRVL
jgi:hypothetical protein